MPETSPTGFLLVGHGTRRADGQQQFRDLFTQFAPLVHPFASELSFLELAEPSIPAAMASLNSRGVRRVVVVPVLLFTAGHAQSDIPGEVQEAAKQFEMRIVAQTESLELSPRVVELSTERFREVVCGPECHASCQGIHCPQVALAMIGRGSSSSTATEQMRAFSQLRQSTTPTAKSVTGFIHAQQPSVPEALEELSRSGCALAVVQPHLLFEGLLMDDLRQAVADCQAANPNQTWKIAMPLGADKRLAELLAAQALDKLRGSSEPCFAPERPCH